MTREQIEKWIGGKGRWLAFSLKECGAYKKDGEINMFYHFQGQGDDKNVFNKDYESIVYFTDTINSFSKGSIDKAEATDKILNEISKL